MAILAILAASLIGLGLYIMGAYNSLVALKNKVDESWSDIDTQLKRRFDLIPNIIESVKGYASHEKDTFEKITQARTMGMNATSVKETEQADNMLSGALKTIFALSENYPDLKANENFMQLQNTLKEIEEHIQMSRRYYNATVRDLNTKIEIFPSNVIANMFKFTKREFFEVENETERQNVKVDFSAK
jgi:LemA protein